MSEGRYAVRPKADCHLGDQAFYYASKGTPELGHRFLVAAHETFSLLAGQPNMGRHSGLKHPDPETLRVYLPLPDGVEFLRVVHGSPDLLALLNRGGFE